MPKKDRHGIEELAKRTEKALEMGGEAKIEKQHELGRLTARERIKKLLDKDSFFEVGALAHSQRKEVQDKTPADGKICGYGTIDTQPVGVSADDVTVLAGAGGIVGYTKEFSVQDFARKKGFPHIHLGEGGGARIPDIMGATGIITFAYDIKHIPRDRFIPKITAIMGECYGGPIWEASVSDIVVQVKGSVMAVASPAILEIATGEKVTKEALGGWEMHADITGLSDLFAENDTEALYLIRKALTYFPANATEFPPKSVGEAPSRFKQNALPDIIPEDERYSYDMHHILESIVDVGSLLELKPYYDGSLITTLARIEGQVVGILANNPKINAGAMGAGACEKAVSFIILCDSFHIPLIFLHDTPGFYVSKKAEDQKMPLRIMDFINALHQCTVPRIAVIIRKSYGMAHNNMSGANMGADFVMAWPRADISFMAPEVAFNVVMGRKIKEMPNPEAVKQTFLEEMNQMNAPWEAVGLGMIDKIIDPRHTRRELIDALRFACTQTGGKSQRKMANWNKM